MRRPRPPERARAFTLVESLVVIAIISMLISILLPSLAEARRQTRSVVCRSNLRQLGVGWVTYAGDWNGHLPGSTWDIDADGRTYDWLGTAAGGGENADLVPSRGTIFPYLAWNAAVYKCPEDKLDPRAQHNNEVRQKVLYSYTAPPILSGAPLALLNGTLWATDFPNNYMWLTQWQNYARSSLPWMILEEDEEYYLNFTTDSAWSNDDSLTDRHRGRAAVVHTDGSVSSRKYQRVPRRMTAWMVLYDLTDGRLVTAGVHPCTFGSILTMWSVPR